MTLAIQENVPLKNFNTFGIHVTARYLIEIHSVEQLQEALLLKGYPTILLLGGGSNVLFTKDLNNLVLLIQLKGVQVVRENNDQVVVEVMAGENWNDIVQWTLSQNYGGLENLIGIPGKMGSAPIQNIGAYGTLLTNSINCFDQNKLFGIPLILQFAVKSL